MVRIKGLNLLIFLLVPACFFLNAGANEKQKPNIVIILTDDLGYGDVSFLNPQSKVKTPQMDALAKEGAWATDALFSKHGV